MGLLFYLHLSFYERKDELVLSHYICPSNFNLFPLVNLHIIDHDTEIDVYAIELNPW